MSDLDGIRLVTEPSESYLNKRQKVDYRNQREDCLSWLLHFGKNPDEAEGYAHTTVKCRSQRMDQFYRWIWEQEGYTGTPTHEHGDAWLRHVAKQDKSNAHKSNCRKAAMMLFKWRQHEHGMDEWDPELQFSTNDGTTNPRDYLTLAECSAVVSPTEYEILLTTIGLLALNLIVTLWVLIRVRQSVVDSHFRV